VVNGGGRSASPPSSIFLYIAHQYSGSMSRRTYLITGATSGIGKVMALELAKKGGTVILVARDQDKGERVKEQLVQDSGNDAIELMMADLASQKQIRELCVRVGERHKRLDGLINNAAIVPRKREVSVDGIEMQFAVNHLSYFLLSYLLKGLLVASAPSRIVNTASELHARKALDLDDLQAKKSYSSFLVYGRTKLMNVYHTYALASRLADKDVSANCWTPGLTATELGRDSNPLARGLFRMMGKSALKGAQTGIYLATDPAMQERTGGYYQRGKAANSSKISKDEGIRERLWRISEEMTGLSGF